MIMTKQPRRSTRLAFRRIAVILCLYLFNAGVNARRSINSLHHVAQWNRNPIARSISLRGGSTKQRRKNQQSANTNDDENDGGTSKDDNSTTTMSSPTSSPTSPSTSSASTSWTPTDLRVFLLSSFLYIVCNSLVSFSPARALVAEIGSERATSTLSIIAACAALTEIFVSPAVGSLLDSTGRKPAFICALFCIAYVHAQVAIHPSVITICIAKYVVMVCFGTFLTTSQVMISDISVSNPERMSSILGVFFALTAGAFFAGAIVAGRISEFGLSVPYGASTVMSALTAALVFFGMQESLHSSKRIPFRENKTRIQKQLLQSPWSSCTSILRHSKEVRILAILIMIQSLPSQMNDTFQIIARTEWDVSVKDYSSFIAMYGLTNIFGHIIGSKMVLKLGIKHFTMVASLSSILPQVLATLLAFRGLLLGCIIGFLGPSQMLGVTSALYLEGGKSNVPQGVLAGQRSSFLALAKVIGPIWFSFLYVKGKEVFGTGFLPFYFNVGCALTAFGISRRFLPSS